MLFSDYLLVHFFGWKPLVYLIMSSFFAGSLHPCAAHFIAEHYLMSGPLLVDGPGGDVHALAQETTSYYGWLNWLCYNVSLHSTHLGERGLKNIRRTRSGIITSTTTFPRFRGRDCPSSDE